MEAEESGSSGLVAEVQSLHGIFYALAKLVQNLTPKGWSVSILVRLLISFNIRLLLSGCLIFGAFVWGKAPLSALLLGIASLLAIITVAGMKKALKKPD